MRIEEAIEQVAHGRLSVKESASAILGVEPELVEGLSDFLQKIKGKAVTAKENLSARLEQKRKERFQTRDARKAARTAPAAVPPKKAWGAEAKKAAGKKRPSFYGRVKGPAAASPAFKAMQARVGKTKAREAALKWKERSAFGLKKE